MEWIGDKIRLKRGHSGCEMSRWVGRDVEWTDRSAGRSWSSPGPELSRKRAKNTDDVERWNSLKSKAEGKQGEDSCQYSSKPK